MSKGLQVNSSETPSDVPVKENFILTGHSWKWGSMSGQQTDKNNTDKSKRVLYG